MRLSILIYELAQSLRQGIAPRTSQGAMIFY
jgi:hypothetical protein